MKALKVFTALGLLILGIVVYIYARPIWVPMYQKVAGKQTVNEVLVKHKQATEQRLGAYFEKAEMEYPPKALTLLAVKDENILELWASNGADYKFIRNYPIQAASGVLGPKLREDDKQVPEGIYQLEYLNPNSAYHLSMKLNYPNSFDLKHAKAEGRNTPGTNIFIHGKAVSIGCLAMGDTVIEELFVLTAIIGKDKVNVAIAPSDPRKTSLASLTEGQPLWVEVLYQDISNYFSQFQHGA